MINSFRKESSKQNWSKNYFSLPRGNVSVQQRNHKRFGKVPQQVITSLWLFVRKTTRLYVWWTGKRDGSEEGTVLLSIWIVWTRGDEYLHQGCGNRK
jgi:hypothetical protein